jgi:putative glutamine amidotransferase
MRIGIVPQEHGEIFGVHQDYLNLVEEFGSPVILPQLEWEDFKKTVKVDGLLLPGGSDVNPRRYKALFSFMSYRPNSYLEFFDTEILPNLIGEDFPIFGVCRGLQTLNVHFGGTLHQHLWKHPHSGFKTDLVHKITVAGLKKEISVNSFHHQAIARLGDALDVIAVSSEDGVVEAIRHQFLPIIAVQWHPERIHDNLSIGYMQELFS